MKKAGNYLLILVAAVLWGTSGVYVNELKALGVGSMEMMFFRALVSALVMGGWMLLRRRELFRIRLRDLWIFAGQGILSFVVFSWCYFTCIKLCSMGAAAALLYLAPAFVALLSAPLFGEKLTLRKGLSVAGVIVGSFSTAGIFTGGGGFPLQGLLIGVLAGFTYALYSIFGRIGVMRYHAVTVNFYTFALAALAAIPFLKPAQVMAHVVQPRALILLVLSGLLGATLPYYLYSIALRQVPTSVASVMSSLEPAVAAVLGWQLYGEPLELHTVVGVLLIVGSVALSVFSGPQKDVRRVRRPRN